MTNSTRGLFQRSHSILVFLLAAAFLLLGGIVLLYTRIPDLSRQVPPNSAPIIVTLRTPTNGDQVGLNFFTSIEVQAFGIRPITSMELWIDGTSAQTMTPIAGSNSKQYSASFMWTPASEGEHTLLVRAIDADHHVGISNIVHINATQEANTSFQASYKPKPGETIDSIAKDFETTSDKIFKLNPQVAPNRHLDTSHLLNIPFEPPPFD